MISPQPQAGNRPDSQSAWLLFSGMAAAAAALIIWMGRDTTFSVDELVVFMSSPGQTLLDALQPVNGHLALTTRLVYHALLEAHGSGYLPFRLLSAAAVVLTASLFFAYAGRRIGSIAALAPSAVLLVFGSDYLHVIAGNGFTILLALSCGLGALLAIDRGDRLGDLVACALLCLGVVSYTVALGFVVGVGVSVLLRKDRWRRAWIVALPIAIYAAWWLWALGQPNSYGEQAEFSNVVLAPSWGFQSLSSTLGALTGLDHDFSPGPFPQLAQTTTTTSVAGPALAATALILVVWRATRSTPGSNAWRALAIVVTLWAAGALVADGFRPPTSIRYLFPAAVGVLLVALELIKGMRWQRVSLTVLFAIAAAGTGVNIIALRDGGEQRRDSEAPQLRAELGALEIAGRHAGADLNVGAVANGSSILTYPFGIARFDGPPTVKYLAAAARYGGVGFSPEQLRAQNEGIRSRADSLLAVSLQIAPAPVGSLNRSGGCRRLVARPAHPISFEISSGAVQFEIHGDTGDVGVRRFADTAEVPVGRAQADTPFSLPIPADDLPEPWRVTLPGRSATVCESG